jgi:hypothetical protein
MVASPEADRVLLVVRRCFGLVLMAMTSLSLTLVLASSGRMTGAAAAIHMAGPRPAMLGVPPETQASAPLNRAHQAVTGGVTVKSLALEGAHAMSTELMKVPPSAPVGREELLFLFPDQYRQMIINPSMWSYHGFSGHTPLLGAKMLDPNGHADAGTPAPNFVDVQRLTAARLLLGILGDAGGVLSANASPTGAGTLHLVGANDFDCLLDLDPATGMPLRVRYADLVGFLPPFDPTQKLWRSDPPERAEVTITFSDRRPVDGVRLPHRITTTARSLSTGRENLREELRFERVLVNPPLTAADFLRVQ